MLDPSQIYDNMLSSIRGEFVDEAEDQLNIIDVILGNIRSGQEDSSEAILKVQRPAHSLKGSASIAEFPLVAIVMHRLEDYLSTLRNINDSNISDIEKFVELAREYSSLDVDQQSVSSSELARRLPAKIIEGVDATPPLMTEPSEDGGPTELPIIEVMMVVKERSAGMLFERELRAAGLRVTTVRNSFDAFQMAVRTKPDLFIVSAVLDILSGVDIANALKSMPTTNDLIICLLTSFDRDHSDLCGLSGEVELIHKNNLKDDLLEILDKHKFLG